MSAAAGTFAAVGLALYAGHHVGDYWIQTAHQSMHKGDAGWGGVFSCLLHVITYMAAQMALLFITVLVLGIELNPLGAVLALLVSGGTHYMADRRDHGLMLWLARRMSWKAPFVEHAGVMRPGGREDKLGLGTGAWALDQSWHIVFGVFVPALLAVAL